MTVYPGVILVCAGGDRSAEIMEILSSRDLARGPKPDDARAVLREVAATREAAAPFRAQDTHPQMTGKLQYRPASMHGNPWLRLPRREVEEP